MTNETCQNPPILGKPRLIHDQSLLSYRAVCWRVSEVCQRVLPLLWATLIVFAVPRHSSTRTAWFARELDSHAPSRRHAVDSIQQENPTWRMRRMKDLTRLVLYLDKQFIFTSPFLRLPSQAFYLCPWSSDDETSSFISFTIPISFTQCVTSELYMFTFVR